MRSDPRCSTSILISCSSSAHPLSSPNAAPPIPSCPPQPPHVPRPALSPPPPPPYPHSPTILLLMLVFAALMRLSLPTLSTFRAITSSMNLQAWGVGGWGVGLRCKEGRRVGTHPEPSPHQ